MNENQNTNKVGFKDGFLAQSLAGLRESAQLTQSQLADRLKGRITLSAAGISRIETGDRPVSEEELSAFLGALATPEAEEFREFVSQSWNELPRPPFTHPDRSSLWGIEVTLCEIKQIYDNPDLKAAFRSQIERYEGRLRAIAGRLLSRSHMIAVVGNIGVGKSTKICRVTGLEISDKDEPVPSPVLEVGGGGITICEVHIKQGPEYGLLVEPRTDDEIRADVADFCDFLIGQANMGEQIAVDADSLGISKEVVRAIRNMAKLPILKRKTADGKHVREDEAKKLAQRIRDPKELFVQILSRMELPRRDQRDIWFSKSTGKEPLVWLRDAFAAINNGRQSSFSLPKRIEVVVPSAVLRQPDEKTSPLNIRIIDTKGIDQTAGRADLECHFDDPDTVVILCTGFNDAPATSVQQLLERARDAGVQDLDVKASILVLPRPGEALAMKDDSGDAVEIDDVGYELKREQIELRLASLGVPTIPVSFFNARTDDVQDVRRFLFERVECLRTHVRCLADELVTTVRKVLENHDKEQYLEVVGEATKRLVLWLNKHRNLNDPRSVTYDALLEAIQRAHSSTIRASVRRGGSWHNLDYEHELGFGARRVAAASIGKAAEDFNVIAENLLDDAELTEAHDFVRQASRHLNELTDAALRRIQEAGRSGYSENLRNSELWTQCASESGRGYRDRVSERNRVWFADDSVEASRRFVVESIVREWSLVIASMEQVLQGDMTSQSIDLNEN